MPNKTIQAEGDPGSYQASKLTKEEEDQVKRENDAAYFKALNSQTGWTGRAVGGGGKKRRKKSKKRKSSKRKKSKKRKSSKRRR